MHTLYTHGGREIFDTDFLAALRSLGIVEGDTLFVHSDTKSFGKLAVSSSEALLGMLVEVFEKSVGTSGTIIMPTFSYSFGKGEPFDVEKTKSTVGSLTEYFRHAPHVIRTTQPMLSVAVWGARAKDIAKIGKDSFGEGSAFENFHKLKGKIVLFGTDFNACTFIHYIEQIHKVPYRFMKTFSGTIIDGSRTYEDSFTYFARPLDGTIENDFSHVEPRLREKGLLREANVGDGTILVMSAEDVFNTTMHMLDADPYCLLERRPTNA